MFYNKLLAFFVTTRPKTIVATVITFTIGTLCAYWDYGNPSYLGIYNLNFSWQKSVLLFFTGVFLQIGANYTNDYFDCYLKKFDSSQRKGPLRAVHTGDLTPRELFWGTCLVYVFALFGGVLLSIKTSVFTFLVTVLFCILSFSYTGGVSFSYKGWGGISAFIIFGPLAVSAIYYTQLGYSIFISRLDFVLLNSLSPGLFALALMSVNNVRDLEEDRFSGKNTLEVRWGEYFGRCQYKYSILSAYISIFFSHIIYRIPYKISLFLLPLMHAFYCIKNFEARTSYKLNLSLQETAINMYFFSAIALLCWGIR